MHGMSDRNVNCAVCDENVMYTIGTKPSAAANVANQSLHGRYAW